MIKPYRLLKKQYPKYLRGFPELKGVYIGGCVKKKVLSENVMAHAHWDPIDERLGWICLCDRRSLDKQTMLHELSHILVGIKSKGHDDPWRRKVLAIGGTIEPRYQKKPRRKKTGK